MKKGPDLFVTIGGIVLAALNLSFAAYIAVETILLTRGAIFLTPLLKSFCVAAVIVNLFYIALIAMYLSFRNKKKR